MHTWQPMTSRTRFLSFIALGLTLTSPACGQEEVTGGMPEEATSHLLGRLTVSAEIDTTQDYRGFEVLVAVDVRGQPDTLGYAMTDIDGTYALDVTAASRGIYALIISKGGQILKIGELAVAEGDSATMDATFPLGNRQLRVRSAENAAWMAYQNTKAQHHARLLELVKTASYDEATARLQMELTTMILWNMQSTFPGTMGGEAAAAEAVVMGTGWIDSLSVERARSVPPEFVNFAAVGRAARRALARLEGQAAALALLREFRERAVREDDSAQLHSELVLAHLDSLAHDDAIAEAELLADTYPESPWQRWAERAIYEIETLTPGKPAPALAAVTAEGDSFELHDLRGRWVILEFYRPQDAVYQRELEVRAALTRQAGDDALSVVSISLEPDTLLNDAFLDGRDIPGRHVFAADDALAVLYNISRVPTRYLVDPEGMIAAKYVGGAIEALREDVLALLEPDGSR